MKYYLWILGCAMNYSDAERISAVLESLGYEKTEVENESDLILTIACSVRQTAIDRIYGKSKVWQKLKTKNQNLKTVLTGCVLEKDRKKMTEVFDVIFEIDELAKLPGLLGAELAPEKKSILGKSGEYLGIAPVYDSKFRALVPIMTGCNNFCSYCAVPYTRGREKSRPVEEIYLEVSDLVKKGFKEITLLGQNVNSYQFGFVDLLKRLDEIDGDYRIYFYSNHPKDMSDELIEIMPKLKHFPPYIHLPLQSGDDEILKRMNRHYTVEQYLGLVSKIRKAMPDVTLTTDVIVGFPGETEEQFEKTMEVARIAKYDMIFIGQYSPRPGTLSSKLEDDIPKAVKKDREKVLTNLLAEILKETNQKLVGTTQKVLIDEQKGDMLYGRTEGYKVVEIENRDYPERAKQVEGSPASKDKTDLVGRFCDVQVKKAASWKLSGELFFTTTD